ncbi:MAG: class I SAM-dependent methyltransferase [Anaerolineaceae bacterium]|nr:class I SAM-dependent methyltransferase [Anaerolineaceae bacterium]
MSAITQWKKIVSAYRKASLKKGFQWQGEHAKWYDGWVKENNYAEAVYPIFQPFVHGKVLEIGAGTGLFTQYLMHDADHVDAVEPSADMLDLLKRNVCNKKNINYHKTNIESFDFQMKCYEFSFAAHAFFNVLRIDEVLKEILNHCEVMGVLIGSGKPLDIFQIFCEEHLLNQERPRPPCHLDLISVLEECGLYYDIQFLHTSTTYCYESEAVLLEKVASQCGIRESARGAFFTLISPHIQKKKRGCFLQGNREHVCLLISKTAADFNYCNTAK